MTGHLANHRRVWVDGIEISSTVHGAMLLVESEPVANRAQGQEWIDHLSGLADVVLTLEVSIDYAAGSSWEIFRDLVGQSAVIEVLPDSREPIGATNPEFSGRFLVTQSVHMAGDVGGLATAPLAFAFAGEALTYATTAGEWLMDGVGEYGWDDPAAEWG